MSKDFYNVLGVPENAAKDDIKKSFRKLAKQYHPDRNPGNKAAEARFKEITEAYEVLGDDKKREQYDMMRKYGAFGGGFGPGAAGTGGFDPSQFGGSFRFEDLGGFGSFADIFSSIFGDEDIFSGARRGRKPQPRKGSDLAINLSVSFEESISGTGKTIILNKPSLCDICRGSGEEPGSGQQICPQCSGRGSVSYAQGAFSISRPCPRCLGRGAIPGRPCFKCSGTGRVKEKKKVRIKIPAGINDGGKVRLRGMGNPGDNGGPEGDLVITVNVGENQQFKRQGNDIYTTAEISFPQAVLGSKIPIKTLTRTVNLSIPPGTKSGTKLRLRGMGLTVNGSQGDQFVEIDIKVPKEISPKQKELLEELAKTMQD